MQKHLLVPTRVRRVPHRFSWVDQRLVRDRWVERCDVAALALYLFLVTVSDAQGLSFYGDAAVERLLGLSPQALARARQSLIDADLVAYQAPLYQVLALDPPGSASSETRTAGSRPTPASGAVAKGELRSLREVLRSALGEPS